MLGAQEERRAQPAAGDMSGAELPARLIALQRRKRAFHKEGGHSPHQTTTQQEGKPPDRNTHSRSGKPQATMTCATASATRMPSTPADRIPPA